VAPVSRTTLIAALVLAGCGRIGFGLGGGAGGGGGGDGNSGGDGASAPDASSGTSLIKAIGAGTVTVWDDTVNSSRAVELPAGTQDGDLLVMHATWAVNFGTWTAPSLGGWTATVAPWTDPHCNYSASAVYMKVAVAITMMPAAQAICTAGGSQDFAGGYLAQSNAGVVPAQTIVTTNENLDGWTGVMLALKPAPP